MSEFVLVLLLELLLEFLLEFLLLLVLVLAHKRYHIHQHSVQQNPVHQITNLFGQIEYILFLSHHLKLRKMVILYHHHMLCMNNYH
ncbi:MAG: hypothetical protein EBY07_15285 [Actinobacteria bacterium]|nr:hypothetical protein [Actinomycetota bacterium]